MIHILLYGRDRIYVYAYMFMIARVQVKHVHFSIPVHVLLSDAVFCCFVLLSSVVSLGSLRHAKIETILDVLPTAVETVRESQLTCEGNTQQQHQIQQ